VGGSGSSKPEHLLTAGAAAALASLLWAFFSRRIAVGYPITGEADCRLRIAFNFVAPWVVYATRIRLRARRDDQVLRDNDSEGKLSCFWGTLIKSIRPVKLAMRPFDPIEARRRSTLRMSSLRARPGHVDTAQAVPQVAPGNLVRSVRV